MSKKALWYDYGGGVKKLLWRGLAKKVTWGDASCNCCPGCANCLGATSATALVEINGSGCGLDGAYVLSRESGEGANLCRYHYYFDDAHLFHIDLGFERFGGLTYDILVNVYWMPYCNVEFYGGDGSKPSCGPYLAFPLTRGTYQALGCPSCNLSAATCKITLPAP